MATDKTIRDALLDVMAKAVRENDDYTKTHVEVARTAAQATGLRRAVWATLTPTSQKRLVIAAIKRAGQGPIE